MHDFYTKYKEEILAVVGIIIPVFIGIVSKFFEENSLALYLSNYWSYYLIVILTVYVFYQAKQKRTTPLTIYSKGGNPDFNRTIDLSYSSYWYLGMGAEEFLRDVNVEEYFVNRRNEGRPFNNIRFLFLHPDSEYFLERLKNVNANRDLQAVTLAKRSYLQTLHHSLATLPKDVLQNYEIRYYDERPIWLLQFFDHKQTRGQFVGVVVSMEIPRIHSNLSNQYLCKSDNTSRLFDIYKLHFETLWENAIPARTPGDFPKLIK